MVAVIVCSRHCNINPDNVATPIAASLGDLTTLALLAWISSLLFDAIGKRNVTLKFGPKCINLFRFQFLF
jgi:hypothetical protein